MFTVSQAWQVFHTPQDSAERKFGGFTGKLKQLVKELQQI